MSITPTASPPADERPAPEVLVMGSLFAELTPAHEGESLRDMTGLVPLAAGAASNFALALAALGHRVGLLGRVGQDAVGDWLVRRMAEQGVETAAILRDDQQLTPVTFAWADRQGGKEFLFYRFPGYSDPTSSLSPGELPREQIQAARLFDFTEAVIRQEPVRAAALEAARLARAAGRRVVYAVNYRPAGWQAPLEELRAVQQEAIARADVAVMNAEEYELIFGQEPANKSRQNYTNLDNTALVVTRGEKGGWVIEKETVAEFEPFRVPVTYDVGAGDAFHAGIVSGLLQQMPLGQAARYAAACAALKISRPASSPPPGRAEVRALLGETP